MDTEAHRAATGRDDALDIGSLLDNARVGSLQITVFLLCLAGMIFEGYDTYAVSYVGPAIAAGWNVDPSVMGIVFTSGIVGSAVAYLAIGPVSDRHGRRRLVIAGTAAFGVATLLSVTAWSIDTFIFWRVLSGLALGTVLPNIVSTAAEFSPARYRSLAVVVLYSGFAIGSALAGVIANHLVPDFGWRSVFVFGGGVPILLAGIMLLLLPESPRFLALQGGNDRRIGTILGRLPGGATHPSSTRFILAGEQVSRQPVGDLFRQGRGLSTVMIWLILAMDSATIGSLIFWIPTLVKGAGLTVAAGINFSVILLMGGIAGAFLIGYAMDRLGVYRVLIVAHLSAALLILTFAWMVETSPVIIGFLIGIALNGGTSGAQGLLARLYPTFMRATGVGWASGVARFVGIGQPLITGLMLSAMWTPGATLMACSIPALVSVAALTVMMRDHYGRQAAMAHEPVA